MGKLIDGDKLISTLVWGHYGLCKELQTVQQAINDMRGEDAVPVIRCRECKHSVNEPDIRDGSDVFICCRTHGSRFEGKRDPGGFCYWAERKEE